MVPLWCVVLVLAISVYAKGELLANDHSETCRVEPATQHDAQLIVKAIREGNSLIWITIDNIYKITSFNETTNLVNPKQWVLTTDEPHKQLLLLSQDFIPVSLLTLSFRVVNITINTVAIPSECILKLNVSEQELLLYQQIIGNIFNSSVDLPDTSEVCLQHIRDNGNGKADIYYRCYDDFKHYKLEKGPWMNWIEYIHIISSFMITNYILYLILQAFEAFLVKETYVLKYEDSATRDIKVPKTCLVEKQTYPSTLLSFILNRVICCSSNFETRSTASLVSDMCYCSKWRKRKIHIFTMLFGCFQTFIMTLPFILAHSFDNDSLYGIIETAATERNLTIPFSYKLQSGDPDLLSDIFMLYVVSLGVLYVTVIFILICFCMRGETMSIDTLKTTILQEIKVLSQSMYEQSCKKTALYFHYTALRFKKGRILAWILSPLFVTYMVFVWTLNMPVVHFVFSLLKNSLFHLSRIVCRRNDDKKSSLTAVVVDVLALAVISFVCVIPYSYSVYFYVKVIAYVAIGLQLNFDSANKYAVTIILVIVYSYHCFHRVSVRTLKYSNLIHDHLQNKLKGRIEIALNITSSTTSNLLHIQNDQQEVFRIGLVCTNSIGNRDIGYPPVTEETPINLSARLPLVYFVDKRRGCFFLPRKFIIEALEIEDAVSPGALGLQYWKAFKEFLLCIAILFFVLVIVFALGQSLTLSATGQTAFTVAGGVLPFLLEKLHAKSSYTNDSQNTGLDIWKSKLDCLLSLDLDWSYSFDTANDKHSPNNI